MDRDRERYSEPTVYSRMDTIAGPIGRMIPVRNARPPAPLEQHRWLKFCARHSFLCLEATNAERSSLGSKKTLLNTDYFQLVGVVCRRPWNVLVSIFGVSTSAGRILVRRWFRRLGRISFATALPAAAGRAQTQHHQRLFMRATSAHITRSCLLPLPRWILKV